MPERERQHSGQRDGWKDCHIYYCYTGLQYLFWAVINVASTRPCLSTVVFSFSEYNGLSVNQMPSFQANLQFNYVLGPEKEISTLFLDQFYIKYQVIDC